MAEGFSERPYQHHYVQTQSENNGPIPDQQTEQDAEDILKACSSFSDIQDDNGAVGQRTESNPKSWSEANICDRDSCQLNGQGSLDGNLRAEANSNICHDPENNLTTGAVNPPTTDINLPENPDETQLKLVVTLEDFRRKPQSNHYTQNHDKIVNIRQRNRNNINDETQKIPVQTPNILVPVLPNNTEGTDTIENICPGNINDIGRNGQTPNIPVPVQPNNNEGDKLVINCSHETLEYLNDHLIPRYSANWKHIASIHKWDNQKIVHFEYKNKPLEFERLVFQEEFCTYTVNNLLADLKTIQRQDILNDYPSKWS